MWKQWGTMMCAASVLCILAGCGGLNSANSNPDQPAGAFAPDAVGVGRSVPLPDVSRLAAAGGEFASEQDGSSFAADLANNLAYAAAPLGIMTPACDDGRLSSLDEAAYCLYRLRLDATPETATLTLVWEGLVPAEETCWIGLADWQAGTWQWRQLPESGELVLDEPSRFADGEQRCFAAVMVLDDGAFALAKIGFGPEPEPPAQYTLFAPMQGTTTYLVDSDGNVAHSWPSDYKPAASVYLLEDGHLLRSSALAGSVLQHGPGAGGLIQELAWDGSVAWSSEVSTDTLLQHHDIEPLPDGNILVTAWERITEEAALAAGRAPELLADGEVYADCVLEIRPLEGSGHEVVWEWHSWDHLIQDVDPLLPNYGEISAHLELLNVNYADHGHRDWTHCNAVHYSADLDQIALSIHGFDELWIIDHSTTTEEAAGHSGGRWGRGGDLLYRWGNPQAHGVVSGGIKQLEGQHDVQWIPDGYPGAGHLLLFNNGSLATGRFSTVIELVPPTDEDGNYVLEGAFYGPAEPYWIYTHDPPTGMFSASMSGAQRLPSGNTLISLGDSGWMLEVTADGELVWEFTNPYPAGWNHSIFRATRISGDYPGLAELAP